MISLSICPELAAFRSEVRAFLDANLTDEMRRGQAAVSAVYPEPEESLAWQKVLAAHGWAAPVWPKQFGGPGWNAVQRFIFETECALAGAPLVYPIGIRLVGPVVQAFGTAEQQQRWLPRILSGEDYWCQGFSEPGAGSDLASLSTRAIENDGRYIVNGSKIWTTHAHHANRMFALVRTSSSGKRQDGITALAVDLDTPGIEVRPIISIAGDHDVNEVFFTDVEVPLANRIGGEGDGWTIAKYLLEFERGTGMFAGRLRSSLKRVIVAANARDLLQQPELRQTLAMLVAEIDCFEMLEFKTLSRVEPGDSPGPAASVLKLRASRLKQAIGNAGLEVLGEDALAFQERGSSTIDTLVGDALNSRAATIFGGASEIQLSIIAKSLAGL